MTTRITDPSHALHLFRSGTNFKFQGKRVVKMYEYSISPRRIDGRDDEDDKLAVEIEGEIGAIPCRPERLTVA